MGSGFLRSGDGATSDESDRVRRARNGDHAAWAELHDLHFSLLYRYAYARLRNHHDAEDVASQTFVEAIKSIDRFNYASRPIQAWFYGIASNLVSHRLRALQRQVSHSGVLTERPSASSEDSWVDNLALQSAMEQIKAEHREMIILRYVLGLRVREVATLLGKSEAATYSLQVRAVEALRRAMS